MRFQAYYSPEGKAGLIGTNYSEKLECYQQRIARFDHRLATQTLTKRKRRELQRSRRKCFEKVQRIVTNLHREVCAWVAKEGYTIILLPKFDTHEMLEGKTLSSDTKKKLQTWSHYKFKHRLIEYAQKFSSMYVRVVNESYTTQSCGGCGNLYKPSGRLYRCKRSGCMLFIDRDINAARNVLLKNLDKWLELVEAILEGSDGQQPIEMPKRKRSRTQT